MSLKLDKSTLYLCWLPFEKKFSEKKRQDEGGYCLTSGIGNIDSVSNSDVPLGSSIRLQVSKLGFNSNVALKLIYLLSVVKRLQLLLQLLHELLLASYFFRLLRIATSALISQLS